LMNKPDDHSQHRCTFDSANIQLENLDLTSIQELMKN